MGRSMSKQQKANLKAGTPNAGSDTAEPELVEETVKSTA
jgi:hypothetical protein